MKTIDTTITATIAAATAGIDLTVARVVDERVTVSVARTDGRATVTCTLAGACAELRVGPVVLRAPRTSTAHKRSGRRNARRRSPSTEASCSTPSSASPAPPRSS